MVEVGAIASPYPEETLSDNSMLLKNKTSDTLVEIVDIAALVNPTEPDVTVQGQEGQEEQDPTPIAKQELFFPSGESLPRCWVDADYQS